MWLIISCTGRFLFFTMEKNPFFCKKNWFRVRNINRWESWNIPVPGTCWLSDIIDTYLDPEVRYRCCDGCDWPAGPHLTSARHSSQGIASFAINQSTTSRQFWYLGYGGHLIFSINQSTTSCQVSGSLLLFNQSVKHLMTVFFCLPFQ